MWKRKELSEDKEYVLNLCQKGSRFCRVAEVDSLENSDVLVFKTQVIPNNLIESYSWKEISEKYKTEDGQKFYFGPHGEWLIDIEAEALEEEVDVPWVTKEHPSIAPR